MVCNDWSFKIKFFLKYSLFIVKNSPVVMGMFFIMPNIVGIHSFLFQLQKFFTGLQKKMNNKKTMESLLLSGFCFKLEDFMNLKEGNNLLHDKNGKLNIFIKNGILETFTFQKEKIAFDKNIIEISDDEESNDI